jgi:Matrixin
VRVDPTDGKPRGLEDVIPAIDRLRRVTGLPIEYGGTLTFNSNSAFDVSSRQVVIRWRSSSQDPSLVGTTIGTARPLGYNSTGEFDRALVTLRTDIFPFENGFGPGGTWGMVILHELGHAFGLDHTFDSDQLMYPSRQRGLAEYGAGDLSGLKTIRRDGCFARVDEQPTEMVIVG